MSSSTAREATTRAVTKEAPTDRLLSLDAYRGAIMVSLAFGGFGLAETAKLHLDHHGPSRFWSNVAYQFEHVAWAGCTYWDLIQPSFMFMVGVSMAYSYVKRESLGHSYANMLGHAVVRAIVLVLLGVFLSSNWDTSTNWTFMNVLSQIGLGYAFLFLMWRRSSLVQLSVVTLLLVVTWLAYTRYPTAGIDLQQGESQVGITAEWAQEHLSGIAPAWHKNANLGHALDVRLLNRLPRREPFEFNSGGYQTINFVPSLATMILGLVCGQWLRSSMSDSRKWWAIIGLGAVCMALGWGLAWAEVSPLVKRIWTPTWALYSTGWCCLILASLYGLIDIWKFKGWAFPLIVVGTNSIAVYMMSQLLKSWVAKTLQTHLGQEVFLMLGPLWEPFLKSTMIGLVFWLICLWLYKQRVFLRI
jgi:heparan-alpha-glucosaminide N-acetyltransferase